MILRHLYTLPIGFRAKMATLHSGQNCWPDEPRGIFVQHLLEFFLFVFFYSNRIFCLFVGPLYMPPTSSRAKMTTLHSRLNSWPDWHRRIFVQNLPNFFFIYFLKNFLFVSWTYIYDTNKFSCKNGDISFSSKFLTRLT